MSCNTTYFDELQQTVIASCNKTRFDELQQHFNLQSYHVGYHFQQNFNTTKSLEILNPNGM
jgi:hypothetical protein